MAWSCAASRSSRREPTIRVVAATDSDDSRGERGDPASADDRAGPADARAHRRRAAAATAGRGPPRPPRAAACDGRPRAARRARARTPGSARAGRATASATTASRTSALDAPEAVELERARRRSRRGGRPRPAPSGVSPAMSRSRPSGSTAASLEHLAVPRRDPSSSYPSSPDRGRHRLLSSSSGVAQPQQRPPRPRLHRAERPAEPLGDLRLGQLLAVGQDDHRPLLGPPCRRAPRDRRPGSPSRRTPPPDRSGIGAPRPPSQLSRPARGLRLRLVRLAGRVTSATSCGRRPAARSRSTVRLRAIVCSQAESDPARGSNISARSHSARNVSWTTSSATA